MYGNFGKTRKNSSSVHLEYCVEIRSLGKDLAGHGSFQEVVAEEVLHHRLGYSSHRRVGDSFRLERVVCGQESLFFVRHSDETVNSGTTNKYIELCEKKKEEKKTHK